MNVFCDLQKYYAVNNACVSRWQIKMIYQGNARSGCVTLRNTHKENKRVKSERLFAHLLFFYFLNYS